MFIFFCGPPFCGKSTQTQKVLEAFKDFRLLSSSNIINDRKNFNVLTQTEDEGKQLTIKEILDRGWYVDAPTVLKLLKNEIETFAGAPIISDSYPRSVIQLGDLESKLGVKLSLIFYLHASDEKTHKKIFERRRADRRVCPTCRVNYDPKTNPAADGKCATDGAHLEIKFDDMGELPLKRLESYMKNAAPMAEVLKNYPGFVDVVIDIDGKEIPPDEIFSKQILPAITKMVSPLKAFA